MNDVTVKTTQETYAIHLCDDFLKLDYCFKISNLEGRKVCIITDTNVAPLYADVVSEQLEDVAESVHCFVFEAGETSKNLQTVSDCYHFCLAHKLDRTSVILALGGGVVGDMAGFVAATFMRGLTFVQVPTTLLSQVDSSVGGKVGVDFSENKNLIGAFYQPQFVYINVATLTTLPPVQFNSGMGEAIKHGLIADQAYFEWIQTNQGHIKALDDEVLKALIHGSCKIKAAVVSQDEKESGLREILNFGHTFGHAIETLSGFFMPHGQCVAIGAMAALYLSEKMGMITGDTVDAAKELLLAFDLIAPTQQFSSDAIYQQMFLDKKTKNGKINLVLLEKMGQAFVFKDARPDGILWAISKMKAC